MFIEIPSYVEKIIKSLHRNNFEAYLVGGCVRDALMGISPHDYDITSSATPEEIKSSLQEFRVLETGLKHGTVTVLSEGNPVEITTYRVDGKYSDGRHPDSVQFTRNLKEDLARRDFTVNALAYNNQDGLVDYFSGQEDLKNKIIRCIRTPDERFQEDALRILRALRFASVLSFSIDPETASSLLKNRYLLSTISKERIASEWTQLLCNKNVASILNDFKDVIVEFIPEITDSFNFNQHNPHHLYSIWEHTLKCLVAIEPDPILRLAMFFHDLGKPYCFTLDKNQVGHFYGHAEKSSQICKKVLHRLRYSKDVVEKVCSLVFYHNLEVPTTLKSTKRWLNRLGEETMKNLIKVYRADLLGKGICNDTTQKAIALCDMYVNRIVEKNLCFQITDLDINGQELMQIGCKEGKDIGRALQYLLDKVIDENYPNQKAKLIKKIQEDFLI